jgi:hypothetical protein
MNLHPDRLPLTFASPRKPIAHRFGQPRRRNAQPGFDLAVAGGQGVIEFGLAGEIAHAKAVEPIQRAGTPLGADEDFDEKFLGVDSSSISSVANAKELVTLKTGPQLVDAS